MEITVDAFWTVTIAAVLGLAAFSLLLFAAQALRGRVRLFGWLADHIIGPVFLLVVAIYVAIILLIATPAVFLWELGLLPDWIASAL